MGGGHVFLATFTNCSLIIGFEPTKKIIDLSARNQSANPYIDQRSLSKEKELDEQLKRRGIKQNFYLSCINWPHQQLDQEISVITCDSPKTIPRWSRAISYSKEREDDWLFSSAYKNSRTFEYLETSDEEFNANVNICPSYGLRFGTGSLDIVHRDVNLLPDLENSLDVGLLYIDIWNTSEIFDILRGAETIIWSDKPVIAAVIHSTLDELESYKLKLQSTLGDDYVLVGQLPDAIDNESTCLLYACEEHK